MDVRFRTLPPDKLARQITPGQPQSGDEQNFLEVIESLTSSEHTPEQSGDTGGGRQSPGTTSARTGPGPGDESEEESAQATPETLAENSATKSPDTSDPPEPAEPDEPPIGKHIDLIA